MSFQVKDILVVASDYDAFMLEEEGLFSDRLLADYRELDLGSPPSIEHVDSARGALAALRRRHFDLVLTTPHLRDGRPERLAAEIAERHPELPVVLVVNDRADARTRAGAQAIPGLQQVFVWTGDPRLLLAIVKSVEDRRNAWRDTRKGLVRVILLIEDSPTFASAYLPLIYSELLEQVRQLLADRLNQRERHYRMRARPKILLARSFEEARGLFRHYQRYLLGLLCDVEFPRAGQLDPGAGLELIRWVRRQLPDLPVLLQSREPAHADLASALSVAFLDKNSPELLGRLRHFMRGNFGFGPFVFRQPPDFAEVERAGGIRAMVEVLARVPEASLAYHATRNHFSNWLMARSEFGLAQEVGPKRITDFADASELRAYLLRVFREFVEQRQRGQVTEFARRQGPLPRDFVRIGTGSLGGKARGIAFVASLLARHEIHGRFPGIRIGVPRTVVLATDVFERFCEQGRLRERALEAADDAAVARLFLDQPLDDELTADLASLLDDARFPLAVRSSSLLEDSEFNPLAGLYRTMLLPNIDGSAQVRLGELSRAVRLIWASTFFAAPRRSMAVTGQRLEEERMAVIVERLVGRRHGDRFYPDFAGVAQSLNFYPLGALATEDGLAAVALGLGETVVSGGRALRFSPRHPRILPQMASAAAALRSSQRRFWALDLAAIASGGDDLDPRAGLVHLDLAVAEADGTLAAVGGTYVRDDDRIVDSLEPAGARLVNFSGVLKHGLFPLAPLLDELLTLGREGMGMAVELEFAALVAAGDQPAELAVVQLRPLAGRGADGEVDLAADPGRPRLVEGPALGHGVVGGLEEAIYLHPHRAEPGRSREVAKLLARWNAELVRDGRPYLLIGPGRWGTADPWLGVPVAWPDIAGARAIVEVVPAGSPIEASQGSHFFHNLISLRIGYFTVSPGAPGHRLDLEALDRLPAVAEEGFLRRVALPHPAESRIDGRTGRGVVVG